MILKIEVTKYCNQLCSHCSYSRKYSTDESYLSLAELKEQVARHKPRGFFAPKFQVMITGGEPLLNPEIFEIIDFLSKNGANYISLATNLIPVLNNPELSQKLIQSKISELIVSLAPTNEDYKAVRFSEQQPILDELQNIKSARPKLTITANYLIHKQNIPKMEKFLKTLQSLPFSLARFLTYNQSLAPQGSPLTEMVSLSPLEALVRHHNSTKPKVEVLLVNFNRSQIQESGVVFISPNSKQKLIA